MKKNKTIYYAMIFMVLIIIFSLFEAAIITAETFPSSNSEKFFWTAMNVGIIIGIPVGVISINKLTD